MQMTNNLDSKCVESYKLIFPKVSTVEKTDRLPFLLEGVGGD
jgi:hypothetical protein